MDARKLVGDFTRGAMDRVRELAGVPDLPEGLVRTEDGWEFVAPGVLYQFKIEPKSPHYSTLRVKVTGAKAFMPAAHLRVLYLEQDAMAFIENFLRGVT